jgi:predicted DNA-binding ribbon-helix-helix protein
MRVDNSTGKDTSGMDKFSSKVHRVHMELGGKLFSSLRIETQFLERLKSVSAVDGAAHTQKDDVKSNRGSLENVAKVFVLNCSRHTARGSETFAVCGDITSLRYMHL